jgi:centromere-localized protein 2
LTEWVLTPGQLRDEEPPSEARGEPHTMETLLPAMDQAAEDIEEEIRMLEEEAAKTLQDIQTTVGDLSDLRYGRLPRAPIGEDDLAADVVNGLARLEQVCREATEPSDENMT